jgi:hypothetical protein
MPWMIPAAIIGSSLLGSSAAKSAASTQSAAADRAAELQNQQFQQTREDQAPYRQAGYTALDKMQNMAGNVPGAFKFGNEAMYQDPGYAFRLSEGMKAMNNTAAARGGLISGNALRAGQAYGQQMGSQEYQNAYNRALTGYNTGVASENQLYNRQAGLAGIGQTAANFVGQTGAANAANVGNLITGGAAANAAGYMGAANAGAQGVSQYINYNQGNNLLSTLQNNRLINQYGAGNVYTPQGGGNTNLSWNGEA